MENAPFGGMFSLHCVILVGFEQGTLEAAREGASVTVWDLLATCRRQWIILMLGLLLTTGAVMWVRDQQGVFWAQSDEIFLSPKSSRFPNSLNTSSESLINTAGLVESLVDNGSSPLGVTSSSSASLVDLGVRDGTMVRLPNVGGQWAFNFAQPVLDLQVVAATPEEVARRMEELQTKVQAALTERQDAAGVALVNRITIQASPTSLDIQYRQGDQRRAVAAAGALGVILSVAAAVALDRRRITRRPLAGGLTTSSNAGMTDSVVRMHELSSVSRDR